MTCPEFQKALEHYTSLAQEPGWWDYCRHRVQLMEQDDSGLYVGLRQAVRERLQALGFRGGR